MPISPAERAARLALVQDDEAEAVRREEMALAAARKHGSWSWRVVGQELQFRSKALPTIRIDILRPEARDLMTALAKALNEKAPPTPRMTKRERAEANKARRSWNKAHNVERTYALQQLVKEFQESRGGW